jgi:hypothetical protein
MTESGVVSFSSKSAWPESLELKLLAYVQTLNCHIPTDEKKVDKWNQLHQKLSADPGFNGRTSSAKNLQVKYNRILDRISTKYGLNGKGANLSGLPETASQLESLALDLLKQTYDADEANKERKASQEKKQRTMLTHESAILRLGPASKGRIPSTEPFHQNLEDALMSPQSPTDSTTNSTSDSSRSTPSPKKSNSINLDWEGEKGFLDYLLLNMRSPPSTTAEMATTAVGLPQTTTPDERRLELELKLAEAATAKIVAETAKIEAECKLLQLQNSRKRCRDEELVEVDLRSEFSPDKI